MKFQTTPCVYVEVYFNKEERPLFWQFMIDNVEDVHSVVHFEESSGQYHKGFYSQEAAEKIVNWVKQLNKQEETS